MLRAWAGVSFKVAIDEVVSLAAATVAMIVEVVVVSVVVVVVVVFRSLGIYCRGCSSALNKVCWYTAI